MRKLAYPEFPIYIHMIICMLVLIGNNACQGIWGFNELDHLKGINSLLKPLGRNDQIGQLIGQF